LYAIYLSKRAQDFLKKLDGTIRKRIENRIRKLDQNPVPSDAKFIFRDKGEKVFRCRIGKYRALYKIKEKDKAIIISKIDKRPRIYNR
jgi:mRNA interferase RelE/StbE